MRVKGTAVKSNQTQTLVYREHQCKYHNLLADVKDSLQDRQICHSRSYQLQTTIMQYNAKKKTCKKRSKRKILNRVRRKNPEGEREKGREARTHAQNRPLTPPPRGREGNRQVIDIYELSSLFLECSNSIDPQNNTILTRDQSKTSSQTVEIESPWNGRLHYSTNVLHAPSVPPSQSSP